MQTIIYDNHPGEALRKLVGELAPQSVHVVTDKTVRGLILPGLNPPAEWSVTAIDDGEQNKNIASAMKIWTDMAANGATRQSLVICLGGGVITDMGGFAAATYKRGVPFVNVPTTLLGAVDAAAGGKTGVNFNGLKNEIGVFREARAVLVSTTHLKTLGAKEFLSGYAEMLKHAFLMSPADVERMLAYDPLCQDGDELLSLLRQNIDFKLRVVTRDPLERGPRRMLNFGHTAGHALESLAIEKGAPMPHGFAVAQGMVVELLLSHLNRSLPSSWISRYVDFLREAGYAFPLITCDDYPRLLELMARDKKNQSPGAINFTLLDAPGQPLTDCLPPTDSILTALDISRDLLGM